SGRVVGDGCGRLADGLAKQGGGVPSRCRLAVVARGVETDDRVVVDDAAGLVFGDLDESDPDLGAELLLRDPGQAGEPPGQVDDEPAPQVGAAGVEQDVPGVVVAVRAQWLAEPTIVGVVHSGARDIATVGAAALMGIAAGPAGQRSAGARG